MSSGWVAALVAAVGLGVGWLTFIARLLWTFRGKWDETNAQLDKLASRDALIEQKLDLHIAWHESSCQNWGHAARRPARS